MSSEQPTTTKAAELDLDEDLFGFDQIQAAPEPTESEAELEDIFAAFEELPETTPTPPSPPPPAEPEPAPEARPRIMPVEELQQQQAAAPAPAVVPAPGPEKQDAAPALPGNTSPAAGRRIAFRPVILLVLAATVANALVLALALKRSSDVQEQVLGQVGRFLEERTTPAPDPALAASVSTVPLVAPNAEEHPSFVQAKADIAAGDFGRARRRLYALLAIVDRLDPRERERIEARANYLIARALHLEAVTAAEEER